MTRRILTTSLALTAMASAVEAHTGAGTAGFTHPFTGLDHVLVMVAVGLIAAQRGGRALWLVPGTFLAMMTAGGAAGMAGLNLPFVEAVITVSVVAMVVAVALRGKLPVSMAVALAGVFAVFHGLAHGTEMPADASGLGYALGFIAATAALHAAGIGLGTLSVKRSSVDRIENDPRQPQAIG